MILLAGWTLVILVASSYVVVSMQLLHAILGNMTSLLAVVACGRLSRLV